MPAGSYRTSHNTNDNSCEIFLEGWLSRQKQFMDELQVAQDTNFDEESQEDLINRVLAHYQEYYEEKSRMSHRDVFRVFSPSWFTPLERSFLWITGFKPGLAFSLVTDSVNDLTENQVHRINRLKCETKVEEKSLTDELAKIQESVAAPQLMEVARQVGVQLIDTDSVNRTISNMDENMETFRTAMENVVTDADRLRTRTAERVVALLSPMQSLRFLTAAAQLQLRLRVMGMQREAERQQNEAMDGW